MRRTKTMPESGQFIAVWKYKNKLYSYPLRWKNDELQRYISVDENDDQPDIDGWFKLSGWSHMMDELENVTYITDLP